MGNFYPVRGVVLEPGQSKAHGGLRCPLFFRSFTTVLKSSACQHATDIPILPNGGTFFFGLKNVPKIIIMGQGYYHHGQD